jgi:hypothetical protein
MKKLIIIALSSLIAFSSCTSLRRTSNTETNNTVLVDTVVVTKKEILKDTVIQIQSDSSYFEAMIECDSNNRAYIKEINDMRNGNRVITKVVLKDNIIRVNSKINADSIKIYWKNYYETEYKNSINSTTTSKESVTIKRSGIFSWLKWLAIGFVSGIIVMYTKKWWLPFIRKILTGI